MRGLGRAALGEPSVGELTTSRLDLTDHHDAPDQKGRREPDRLPEARRGRPEPNRVDCAARYRHPATSAVRRLTEWHAAHRIPPYKQGMPLMRSPANPDLSLLATAKRAGLDRCSAPAGAAAPLEEQEPGACCTVNESTIGAQSAALASTRYRIASA
jgi:hypothetical protein